MIQVQIEESSCLLAPATEESATIEPRPRRVSPEGVGCLAFGSMLCGVLSFGVWFGAGIQVPLIAVIGAGIGYVAARRCRDRAALRSERRFAKVGFWIGMTNLFLVSLSVLAAPSKSAKFAALG